MGSPGFFHAPSPRRLYPFPSRLPTLSSAPPPHSSSVFPPARTCALKAQFFCAGSCAASSQPTDQIAEAPVKCYTQLFSAALLREPSTEYLTLFFRELFDFGSGPWGRSSQATQACFSLLTTSQL